MTFDPNLPANNSPISSAELRNQLNALKELIDEQAGQIEELQAALAEKATAIANVSEFNADISDPPTFDNVSDIAGKLNEVINGLKA